MSGRSDTLRDECALGTRRTSGARIGNPAEPPPAWRIPLECLYSGDHERTHHRHRPRPRSHRATARTARPAGADARRGESPGGRGRRLRSGASPPPCRGADPALRSRDLRGRGRQGVSGGARGARIVGLPDRPSREAGQLVRPPQRDPDPARSPLPAANPRTRGADEVRDTGRTTPAPQEGFDERDGRLSCPTGDRGPFRELPLLPLSGARGKGPVRHEGARSPGIVPSSRRFPRVGRRDLPVPVLRLSSPFLRGRGPSRRSCRRPGGPGWHGWPEGAGAADAGAPAEAEGGRRGLPGARP